MTPREALQEIIRINKVIVDSKLDFLTPRTPEMTEGYNNIAKPLLENFKQINGESTNMYLKSLLSKCSDGQRANIQLKSFGNWGHKINPYVWATYYLENDNSRPASHSIQLYIVVNHIGVKFGFDFGDKISTSSAALNTIKESDYSKSLIVKTVNENEMTVIQLGAGEANIEFEHKYSDNKIRTVDDFSLFDERTHIIKSYKAEEIPVNIDNEIESIMNSFMPLFDEFSNSIESSIDKGYWLYSSGTEEKDWLSDFTKGIMSIDYDFPENLDKFNTREELDSSKEEYNIEEGAMNTIRALWDFSKEINIGDVIIAKQGRSRILGYGLVASDYEFRSDYEDSKHTRKVNWIKKGEWNSSFTMPVKTLTNISNDLDKINLIRQKLGIDEAQGANESSEFSLENLLSDVFIDKYEFENIVDLLRLKKNIILQGAAGVGKTFIAKKIAMALQESYSQDNIEMVQFHQSYSYEDFIQGYRPTKDNFELRKGIFYELCDRARADVSNSYFLVIDEINRGNLSKIFGELMMLIEYDKRGKKNKIKLTYSQNNEEFYVPENLYIIGTMNTADRSLSLVDYALRRRFAFIKMSPNFGDKFKSFADKRGLSQPLIERISSKLTSLNSVIKSEDSLGDGFEIGHSFFCTYISGNEERWFSNILEYEIVPLLKEYWFDDMEKVNQLSEELRR